jgi:hypothetical protein
MRPLCDQIIPYKITNYSLPFNSVIRIIRNDLPICEQSMKYSVLEIIQSFILFLA